MHGVDGGVERGGRSKLADRARARFPHAKDVASRGLADGELLEPYAIGGAQVAPQPVGERALDEEQQAEYVDARLLGGHDEPHAVGQNREGKRAVSVALQRGVDDVQQEPIPAAAEQQRLALGTRERQLQSAKRRGRPYESPATLRIPHRSHPSLALAEGHVLLAKRV